VVRNPQSQTTKGPDQARRRRGWCVAATWPDGHFEEIAGFKNETDANDWITKKFQAWLEDREKKDSIA
jgi:hypothetical protein